MNQKICFYFVCSNFSVFFLFLVGVSCLVCAEDWYAPKYISGYGFSQVLDMYLPRDCPSPADHFDPEKISPRDIVFIQSRWPAIFAKDLLPKIQVPFILIIHGGDENFPSSFEGEMDIEEFIQNPHILHIFVQNCDYIGPQKNKITWLPIGIDLHTLAKGGGAFMETKASAKQQELLLDQILTRLKPTTKRKHRVLGDFHLNDTMKNGSFQLHLKMGESRESIAYTLSSSDVVDFMHHRIRRRDYWEIMGEYAFVLCPPGNGLDCHRTWEVLILGSIPIVKSSPLDPLYQGLPVVIVNDWTEITQENLEKWLNLFGDVFHNPFYREKLLFSYWFEKICSID